MPNIEKISIALPPEMVAMLRGVVQTGEYASSSEVVREALRGWSYRRELHQIQIEEVRRLVQESRDDPRPPVSAEQVLERLRDKYRKLVQEQAGK